MTITMKRCLLVTFDNKESQNYIVGEFKENSTTQVGFLKELVHSLEHKAALLSMEGQMYSNDGSLTLIDQIY